MNPVDAVILAVVLAALGTAAGTAGLRWLKEEQGRTGGGPYVTIATLEQALASQQARHDAAMAAQQKRLDSAVARQDVLEREIDRMREERAADHAHMARIERVFEEWKAYARRMAALFREATGQEPPPEPAMQELPKRAAQTLPQIAKALGERFSREELDGLSFDIGIDPESLKGETKMARARALVEAAAHQGKIVELEQRASELRPGEWEL